MYSDADIAQLIQRVNDLEKWKAEHLGPKKGASSLNIPHTNTATGVDMAAAQSAIQTIGRYL